MASISETPVLSTTLPSREHFFFFHEKNSNWIQLRQIWIALIPLPSNVNSQKNPDILIKEIYIFNVANSAYICIYITYIYMVTEWRLERHHFCDACCSWTSSADELFLEQIYIWVLLKRAPTSTQFHPPPLSSNQIHPPPPSLFQPPPFTLQHPQQCSNQNIAPNFPKFRLKNSKLSILTEIWLTWYLADGDSKSRLRCLKFQP